MKCKICDQSTKELFQTKVLGKYDVKYFQCESCHFGQTEEPFWLEEAYNSPINHSDTGLVLRNQRLSKIVSSILFFFFPKSLKGLDFAGGFGMFTRMMRDIGFDFYWTDPYVKNELSRGFEMKPGVNYDVITSFESFEHFDKPWEEFEKIKALGKNLILSTEPISHPAPASKDWWYYAPEHGQHVAFWTPKAFEVLAKKAGMHYYNLDNVHLITEKKMGLIARLLFKFKYAKHIMYLAYFFISPFLKTKTFSDMELMKPSNH